MKKFYIFFVSIFLISNTYLFSYSTDPKEFIKELIEDSLSKLSDKSVSKEDKEVFIENIALQNVDINALGLYTLGELRKSSKKDDLIKYEKTFE